MKSITWLFGLILIIAVACSPNAETTVQDTNTDVEVIDNTSDEAQTADDSTTDETAMEDTEMESTTDESTMENTEMEDTEHSDDTMIEEESSDEMEDSTSDEMEESQAVVEDTSTTTIVAYNGPDWTSLELVNAHTNETFTLADFAGKTVFIEPMATWCTNCRGQQRRINEVIDQLDPNEFMMMSLSVETYITPEELASYSVNNDFDWTFAVASEELLNALVTEFGRSVSSPPSVPHFIISADGTVGNFSTGAKSGEDFLALVRSVVDES